MAKENQTRGVAAGGSQCVWEGLWRSKRALSLSNSLEKKRIKSGFVQRAHRREREREREARYSNQSARVIGQSRWDIIPLAVATVGVSRCSRQRVTRPNGSRTSQREGIRPTRPDWHCVAGLEPLQLRGYSDRSNTQVTRLFYYPSHFWSSLGHSNRFICSN